MLPLVVFRIPRAGLCDFAGVRDAAGLKRDVSAILEH
jgi:hypothetical protein